MSHPDSRFDSGSGSRESQPPYCLARLTAGKTARRVFPPGGSPTFKRMEMKPKPYQREMLKKRGLNWRDWMLVKDTFTSLYFKNVHTGQVKLIGKGERIR